jgi:hypothetical protein
MVNPPPNPESRAGILEPDAKNCSLALEMLALDHFFIYLAQVIEMLTLDQEKTSH